MRWRLIDDVDDDGDIWRRLVSYAGGSALFASYNDNC
jgi:hypothetical protein